MFGPKTDLFGDPVEPRVAGILKQRFVFPPFSVLSARDGDWQERKRAWIACGIKSEIGRGGNLLQLSEQAEEYRRGGYARAFRIGSKATQDAKWAAAAEAAPSGGLTWQGAAASFDHYRVKEGTRQSTDSAGTSVFDPVLCELMYRWFSPADGAVLDPFAGGSVRGIVASCLGRRYTGVDLSARQIEANRAQADIAIGPPPVWIVGDSAAVLPALSPASHDFIFACPPYFDLERYSDDPADLSAMPADGFAAVYTGIIAACARALRPDRFACFVVGDVRDPRTGCYRDLPGLTIRAFAAAGMALYNEAVFVTMVGSLPVRVSAAFNIGRKLGKTHQNILVFVKGDPRRAAAACEQGDVTGVL